MIIRINKNTFSRVIRYILMFLCAMIFAFMFHVERNANMDFNRWQDFMDTIRHSNMSLLDFLSDKTNMLKWFSGTQPFMYSFNTLLYYTSNIFKNNYVIVWISVALDYAIISYIAYDWRRETCYRNREVILSILVCFAFLPIIHVCSGLRTATASCIMTLAVYLFLYRNIKTPIFLVLCLLSVTFHPWTAIAIPIALVIKLSASKLVFFVTVFGCLFISRIADLFAKSGNKILASLAVKYFSYTADNQFRAYRFAMYGVIAFSMVTIVYFMLIYRKKNVSTIRGNILNASMNGDNENRLYLFFVSYMALLIGNIDSYEMVCRGGYIIGASAPIVITIFNGGRQDQRISVLFRIMIIILMLYMCFSWIRYYYPYFI